MLIAAADQPSNLRTSDRVIILKPKDGKSTKSSSGLVDNRLFTGENQLHAIMDTQSMLWSLKYEQGAIPPVLKGNWTSFSKCLAHVKDYFTKREIEVLEVKD